MEYRLASMAKSSEIVLVGNARRHNRYIHAPAARRN
jgi:hypothetical protein